MPHRILYLVSSLTRYGSAHEMAAVACQLPRREFEVEVCALGKVGPVAQQLSDAGITCRTLGRRWMVDPIAQLRLLRYLRQSGPQVVHAWDCTAGFYSATAARWANKPRLIVEQQFASPMQSIWQSMALRWVARSADRLVAFSDMIRDEVQFRDVQWEIIPPGAIEPPSTEMSRDELLSELKLPPDSKLIGVAGPLLPRYGVKELIWAADMVRVLHPTMRMLIIGDGPERPHLERFARTAAEPENICFLGDRNDLPLILPHLDVYWQGSESRVASFALLDAMAAGVPVVASDTPTHREWIVEEESGYLVGKMAGTADRALRTRVTDQLFSEPDLAKQIGEAGQARVRSEFSLDRRVERLAGTYRELLN
ncbi:MAG: glycosyltransferase [Aeoliella sp.]